MEKDSATISDLKEDVDAKHVKLMECLHVFAEASFSNAQIQSMLEFICEQGVDVQGEGNNRNVKRALGNLHVTLREDLRKDLVACRVCCVF